MVHETVRAEEIRVRRVGPRTIGIEHQRTICWPSIKHGGQCVLVAHEAIKVVWVRIVRQHVAADGGVLVRDRTVVASHRCVVDLVDRDCHRGHVAGGSVAVHRVVVEAVRAEVVRVRCVGPRAVGAEQQRAVCRPRDEHGGQRVFVAHEAVEVVWVRVVRQDIAADDVVFVRDRRVVGSHRSVVDLAGRDRHRGRVTGGSVAVHRVVREAVRAEVVRIRGVGKRAVGVEDERSIRRPGIQNGAERVLVADDAVRVVGVEIVGQDVAADRRVFIGRGVVVVRERSVVGFVDCDRDGGDVGIRNSVIGAIGECVGSKEIRIR